MIALENKVSLTFNNPVSFVETKDPEIKATFERYFPGWNFTDDSTREAENSATRALSTIMDCHFVETATYEPILNTRVKGQYDLVFTPLSRDLQAEGLILDPNNGIDVGQNNDIEITTETLPIASIVLIITTSILGIMFVFLVIAYYIRVKG